MKSLKIICSFSILLILSFSFTNSDEVNYFLKTSGNRPFGIAFDKKGLMYMITAPRTGNGTLSKVTPDGEITNIAVLEGNFIGPGIFINDENIFITVGDKLLKVFKDGKTEIVADGFSRCIDVKLDKNENIYVADDLQGAIYKITPSGIMNVFYKSDSTGSFVLTSIAIDSNAECLYARERNRVLRFQLNSKDASKRPEVIIDNTNTFYLCLDSDKNLYASTIDNVIKIDINGKTQKLFKEPLKTSIGIAIGGKCFDNKSLYIAVEDGIIKIPIQK
jgi:glucose/arabinose dehydrogenase